MAKRITAIVGAIALTTAWALLGALPAGATTHTYAGVHCHVLLDGTIDVSGLAPPEDITVNVSAPATANSGSTFTITFPGVANTLPATETGTNINTYQDLTTTFTISGAKFVNGSATHSGNATIGGVNTTQNEIVSAPHTLTITLPGPMSPGQLIPAQVKVHVDLSGVAVGSTIEITGGEVDTTANLAAPLAGHSAVASCPMDSSVLSSTTVLAPPPPGSPKVKPDSAEAKTGGSVTIDVLANDKSGAHKPDASTLKVTTKPKHGTASVTSAAKILYTPKAGYSGIDSFQYHVCSVGGGTCATTAVNVTVAAPPPSTTTTTTTTTTMPVTTTTAAGPQLAHTGSTSVPLSVIGFLASLLGAVAVAIFRPRRDYRLPQ
jgi:hypothetical protein